MVVRRMNVNERKILWFVVSNRQIDGCVVGRLLFRSATSSLYLGDVLHRVFIRYFN